MSDKEIVCTNCEAEFQVVHDEVDSPEYCPFCGDKMRYETDNDLKDLDDEEDNWYPDP